MLEKYQQFIKDRYEAIPCPDPGISLTMANYIPLQLGEESRTEICGKEGRTDIPVCPEDFRVWREEHFVGARHHVMSTWHDAVPLLTPIDVWTALKNKKHVVIKGDPGAGKTTLTHYIAYTLCTQDVGAIHELPLPDLIPLVIDLKDWDSKSISLSEYYADALKHTRLRKKIKPLIYR
ncbi:MAG: nSTAND3 domain-containing NTPase [Candidatus Brocadiales bacterium]